MAENRLKALSEQLSTFRVSDENGQPEAVLRYHRLPTKLREIAYALHDLKASGDRFSSFWSGPQYAKDLAQKEKTLASFEKLSAKDRQTIFKTLAPKLSELLEITWQRLHNAPYQTGYTRKAFRAPHSPAISAEARRDWFESISSCLVDYQPEILDAEWLAQWVPHAFSYRSSHFGPLLGAAIDQKGKAGQAIYDILYDSITGQHEIGMLGDHAICALLNCDREDGIELIEKTLLAAQRQEGLRQAIVENIDFAQPVAFVRLLKVILDQDLLRFSSVARSVDVWLALNWDSASTKVLTENVRQILKYLESEKERKAGLKDSNPENIYRALWATAFYDAPKAIEATKPLLKSKDDAIRYAAAWLLMQLGISDASIALQPMIADSNLQVALIAASSAVGVYSDNLNTIQEHEPTRFSKELVHKRFELLVDLLNRIPEKPTNLKSIIWPWNERTVERVDIIPALFHALGDRPPTDLLPFLKYLTPYQTSSLVELLSAQKKWDGLTRDTLFDLVGHASMDVRKAAFKAIQHVKPSREETLHVESLLTRKSVDVRKNAIKYLASQPDEEALASAKRLAETKNAPQRMAGLEFLRILAQSDRNRAECKQLAEEFRSRRKELLPEEAIQLTAIDESHKPVVTIENGLGFFDPDKLSVPTQPKPNKIKPRSNAAYQLINSLDALVHEHRDHAFTTKTWNGTKECLLGSVSAYELPDLDLRKPLEKQIKKLPLWDVFQSWFDARPKSMKDADGNELLRAYFTLKTSLDWRSKRILEWAQNKENKTVAKAILGEVVPLDLKYPEVVQKIINWLVSIHWSENYIDFALEGWENSLANITPPMMEGVKRRDPSEEEDEETDLDSEEPECWRSLEIFDCWLYFFKAIDWTSNYLDWPDKRFEQFWNIKLFNDRPIPEATRNRMDWATMVEAYRRGLANKHDVMDLLIGPRENSYQGFHYLKQFTDRQRSPPLKQSAETERANQDILNWVDEIRDRVFQLELERGESPTAATQVAYSLDCILGVEKVVQVLRSLGRGNIRTGSMWREETKYSREATLTQLLRVSHPAPHDTFESFSEAIKQLESEGLCDEKRLLEIAFLAPQWNKFIEKYLQWNGFSEGLYWFIAHMDTGYSSIESNAANAEGMADEEQTESETSDDGSAASDEESVEEDSDEEEEDAAYGVNKPRKLSPWQRLLLERTPITDEERSEGAVDVDWFRRTWAELGEDHWKAMAQAAKFAANAAQAKKAQLLADVLLGNTPKKDLVDGIEKRKLKEYVRYLGLLPLDKGAKRQKDLLERYEILVGYKKYAKGLSSLSKPGALLASEIGFQNLARLAGFPDPLRLEWAMEADSVKDLAKGPVSVTKEGLTVTLQLDDQAKPQIEIRRDSKLLKTVPAPLKKKHPEIAELTERATELKKKSSRIKQSLETAMCRGDEITSEELVQLMDHAILSPQLQRLVFVGDGIMGYPDKKGKALRDFKGILEPIKKSEKLRIAHPADLHDSGHWAQWQKECFQAERVQPFKQIFRELYLVTEQERKDGGHSDRFSGQQIQPKQAAALWGSRGWNTQEDIFKVFHDIGLIVSVDMLWGFGTAVEIEGWTVDKVSFRKRDDFRAIPLDQIDPKFFSEVMRDIDLVVSVAHRGEVDPESSASTVEMREALIRETCEFLGIKNVRFKGSHAIIDGTHAEYDLHLGSGNVHRMPGGALCILPVHAQHRGRIFLPFADDDPRTAEVISKVLLLARDEEIQDPSILQQLGAKPAYIDKGIAAQASIGKRKSASENQSSESTPSETLASNKRSNDASEIDPTRPLRQLSFTEGTSDKFWEIEINGTDVTTRWGKRGTSGQSKTKTFTSEADAQKEYDKLLKEKMKKGYT